MSADRYRDLFENSVDPILIIENDRFTDCNKAAHDMLGYPDKHGIMGKRPWEISPELQSDGQRSESKGKKTLATVAKETHQTFEWDHARTDGTVITVEVSLIALPSDSGLRLHCAWRDITKRKLLEEELRHSQKMDVVGKLVGAIAHDFNNQLMPILGYADMLSNALDAESETYEWSREIHRAASLSSALVRKLLAFSRKREVTPVVQDATRRTEEVLSIMRQLIGSKIVVRHKPTNTPQWVSIGEGTVEQIVLNLATNARDAMNDGGELRIEVSASTYERRPAVRIRVADDGAGMDATTRERIFEPFFTTKDLGRGTGLGMSTVADLVSQAGGQITVSSELNVGTTIDVYLPTTDAPHTAQQARKAMTGDTYEAVKDVLVVEDDAHVSRFVTTVLGRHGYRVRACASAKQARAEVFERHPDLLLTDVVIAGNSGPALVRQLQDEGIDLPCIFMSGAPGSELSRQGFDSSTPFLRKPFTVATLLEAVSGALD